MEQYDFLSLMLKETLVCIHVKETFLIIKN